MKWYMVFEEAPNVELQARWDRYSRSGIEADKPQGKGPNRRKKVTNVRPTSGISFRRWQPANIKNKPLRNKGQGPRT